MKFSILLLLFLGFSYLTYSQTDEVDRWDNTLYFGNKIVFGGVKKIKHSHEVQWRAKDNLNALDVIFYEGILTYSPNKKWEIAPDFRLSKEPGAIEYRPGFGIVRKHFFGKSEENVFKSQLVQQLKYQADLKNGELRHGLRYVLTYNFMASEKLILTGLVGPFWRFSEDFTGLQYLRAGVGTTFIFDKAHTLTLINAIGMENRGDGEGPYGSWIPIVQLTIRVNKDYKYTPASYINF